MAIETMFRGIHFRSRLEARWAYVFDALGWRYSYEPIDLKGYIPDFVMQGWEVPTIIEIKGEPFGGQCGANLHKYAEKAIDAGWYGLAICLGATFCEEDGIWIGRTFEKYYEDSGGYVLDDVAVLSKCIVCGSYGIRGSWGSWRLRPCGHYDGDGHFIDLDYSWFDSLWRAAGNEVRWTPKAR
jgi:hypothetical protein